MVITKTVTDLRSSYLKVEVCLCEILVQRRRQAATSQHSNEFSLFLRTSS